MRVPTSSALTTAAAATLLFFAHSTAAQAFFAPDGPVQLVTQTNFNKEVVNIEKPVLAMFFAHWCGHCKKAAPEFNKAARSLDGIVKFAAIDCDATENRDKCAEYKVTGYPTIKLFPATKRRVARDYQGERKAQDFLNYAVEQLPLGAKKLLGTELRSYLDKDPKRPKVVLLSTKATSSPMFRSLALDFRSSHSFAYLRATDDPSHASVFTAARSELGLSDLKNESNLPVLVYVKPGDSFSPASVVKYTGEIKYRQVKAWIDEQVSGVPSSSKPADSAPTAKSARAKLPKKKKKAAKADADEQVIPEGGGTVEWRAAAQNIDSDKNAAVEKLLKDAKAASAKLAAFSSSSASEAAAGAASVGGGVDSAKAASSKLASASSTASEAASGAAAAATDSAKSASSKVKSAASTASEAASGAASAAKASSKSASSKLATASEAASEAAGSAATNSAKAASSQVASAASSASKVASEAASADASETAKPTVNKVAEKVQETIGTVGDALSDAGKKVADAASAVADSETVAKVGEKLGNAADSVRETFEKGGGEAVAGAFGAGKEGAQAAKEAVVEKAGQAAEEVPYDNVGDMLNSDRLLDTLASYLGEVTPGGIEGFKAQYGDQVEQARLAARTAIENAPDKAAAEELVIQAEKWFLDAVQYDEEKLARGDNSDPDDGYDGQVKLSIEQKRKLNALGKVMRKRMAEREAKRDAAKAKATESKAEQAAGGRTHDEL